VYVRNQSMDQSAAGKKSGRARRTTMLPLRSFCTTENAADPRISWGAVRPYTKKRGSVYRRVLQGHLRPRGIG
jgi:hypothetical protein